MGRESSFEDDGHSRQDQQQQDHDDEVHGISSYSRRTATPRDLPPDGMPADSVKKLNFLRTNLGAN